MPKGPKGEKRPADANQLAKLVVEIAVSQANESNLSPTQERASRAGKAGGPARSENLTAERRKEIARAAAIKRWENKDDGGQG